MDGLEAAETENTVETGNESTVLMLSQKCVLIMQDFSGQQFFPEFSSMRCAFGQIEEKLCI